jgi:hypothetical protein
MPIHDWTRVDAGLFHDFHQDMASWAAFPGGFKGLLEPETMQ